MDRITSPPQTSPNQPAKKPMSLESQITKLQAKLKRQNESPEEKRLRVLNIRITKLQKELKAAIQERKVNPFFYSDTTRKAWLTKHAKRENQPASNQPAIRSEYPESINFDQMSSADLPAQKTWNPFR